MMVGQNNLPRRTDFPHLPALVSKGNKDPSFGSQWNDDMSWLMCGGGQRAGGCIDMIFVVYALKMLCWHQRSVHRAYTS